MHHLFPITVEVVATLSTRSEVLGICLVGSKSRGFDDARSDDDLDVFVTDEAFSLTAPDGLVKQYFDTQGTTPKLCTDLRYLSQQIVQDKHLSPLDSDHWPYAGATLLYDRNGCMQEQIIRLGQMDPGFRRQRVTYAALSTTIAIGKTFKAMQRGYTISAQLSLARGANALARLVFALEWRWKPPDHWLERDAHTLNDPAQVVPLLLHTLHAQQPASLREAMDRLEATFPEDVPDREARAALYTTLLHPDHHEDRLSHILL